MPRERVDRDHPLAWRRLPPGVYVSSAGHATFLSVGESDDKATTRLSKPRVNRPPFHAQSVRGGEDAPRDSAALLTISHDVLSARRETGGLFDVGVFVQDAGQ